MLAEIFRFVFFNAVEQIRVVADFAQLHDEVEEVGLVVAVERVLFHQNVFIEFLLSVRQPHIDVDFLFRGDGLLDFLFGAPQDERTQDLVKFLDGFKVGSFGIFLVLIKKVVKNLRVVENVGHQKVEQGPEFVQVVLQGSSCQ